MSAILDPRGLIAGALQSDLPYPIVSLSVGGEIVVVLFDPDAGLGQAGQFENLRAYDATGAEVWRASLPTSTSSDCFVSLDGGNPTMIGARSFSGYRLVIEAATGETTESEFTK